MQTQLLKISFPEYCKIDAINSSKLRDLFVDPKLFHKTHVAKLIPAQDEERYFVVGRAIHSAVLEPQLFNDQFIIGDSRKTNNCW